MTEFRLIWPDRSDLNSILKINRNKANRLIIQWVLLNLFATYQKVGYPVKNVLLSQMGQDHFTEWIFVCEPAVSTRLSCLDKRVFCWSRSHETESRWGGCWLWNTRLHLGQHKHQSPHQCADLLCLPHTLTAAAAATAARGGPTGMWNCYINTTLQKRIQVFALWTVPLTIHVTFWQQQCCTLTIHQPPILVKFSSVTLTVKYRKHLVIFRVTLMLLRQRPVLQIFVQFVLSSWRSDLMVWPDWAVQLSTMSSSHMPPRAGKKGWLKVSDAQAATLYLDFCQV